ncbi:MAG: RNA-binding S4 domain-containing protein [Tissierellia bacterium]|nr:RNA-binding S4 domain-containing protein [Tissierellia bacterium]
MRIDKFLKNSRIIKRRQVAKTACENDRVKVNDKIVKASYDVQKGDIIEIVFGNQILKIRVKELIENAKKNNAEDMYEVIDE